MRPLLRLYRGVHRLSHGVQSRLTPLGGWLLGGWVAAGAFGINTRVGMTYQLFVLLTVAFAIALLASRFGGLPVTARRALPRFATVGQPLSYRLRLHNRGARAQRDLTVFDELREFPPVPVPSQRFPTYRQWRRQITQARGANGASQPLPVLPPGAVTEAELTLTPLRRGWLEFAALNVGRPEPLGLLQRRFRQPLNDRLLVLPRRYPVPPLHFHDGRRYQRGGVHLAQSVGEEDEFIGLREYRPGDPPRRIHWRSFAKRGEPIVKEFQDEFFVRYGLLLDSCAAGVDDARFETAVSAAASIAAAERSPEALLDLLFIGDRAYCFTAGRGLGQTEQVLEVLACVQPQRDQPFARLLALLAGHAPALSACVCILLDWDAERQRLLDLLRSHGVETVVLVIGPPSTPPEPGIRVATAETLAVELARLTP
ncbi:MAG TPA: DUF58 domain-containing protein [Candidatus Contendobacter sp.]|nr:DUF58 domain-containing protein [Candidatus Contendobacter sp.]HRZ22812.1 DUF58 domain-containing protein [Candidatus Contendobacter sp.]HRZ52080.1 DUF58 domain-containing protein [Candidatus Contendobacter sp.]